MGNNDQMITMSRIDASGLVYCIAHERIAVLRQANFAASLAASIAASLTMKDVLNEQDSPISPKKIASISCDIAQQLMEQFKERNWVVELHDPVLPDEEIARLESRFSVKEGA